MITADTNCLILSVFQAWVKYRDEVGMALTDTTAIIGCNLIIQKSGSYLLQILKTCIVGQPSLIF